MNFEEVKKDYLDLVKEYGEPTDMTGGFVDSESMLKVIMNPTKENAKKYLISVIEYGFQFGNFYRSESNGDIYPEYSSIVRRIYNKYIKP